MEARRQTSDSSNPVRVAVVGAGYLGRFHAEKYAGMPDVDLVAVVDINGAAAVEVAEKFQTRSFTRHQDIFDKTDAVSVVTPTLFHYDIARDFLKHGIDVLIEKPMTETLSQADELIGLAQDGNRILQVGHLERFNPAVVALEGIVTTPVFIESHRLSTYKPRGTDVSVVLDLMIHDIDLILNFVNAELTEIRATGIPVISAHGDIANARLEFANGCIANVTASRISMKNERKLRLFQKDAYISIDFANRNITVVRRGGNSSKGIIPGMEIENLSFAHGDALESELSAFVRSVRTRATPTVSGHAGRAALKTALNIMDQIEQTAKRLQGF
jgi:predicted dehydrogenase